MMDAGSVGNVVHYELFNVFILTGCAFTINKLIEVIKRVDVIGTEKQQIIYLEVFSVDFFFNLTLGLTFNTCTI